MATGNPSERKILLRYMVADPDSAARLGIRLTAGWEFRTDEPMLDGPISRRVAVVDIDPDDGSVRPGARYVPPGKRRTRGTYAIADPADTTAADLRQVAVFAAVLRTIALFEEPDVLGRRVTWAFDGEQLIVVPRAGRMANAFYHRESRSLQFFFFDAEIDGRPVTVDTCLSPDIVAHECAHAILDGIAPDLYDSVSPQSLALHESIADLTAVLSAVRTRELALQQLALGGGDLTCAVAFARIAEQFGRATGTDGAEALRDLLRNASLNPAFGEPVAEEPHALSTVLSAALYALLLDMHERERQDIVAALDVPAAEREAALFSASGRALYSAQQRLKRLALRALDYLPPAEIAFADYGRAIIAADTASNPDDSPEREFLKAEFTRRGIVADAAELDPVPPPFDRLPADVDLDGIVRSDWAAYRFAEAHRDALFVPPGVAFTLRPRLAVEKTTWRSGRGEGPAQKATYREVILKVGWTETRPFRGYGGLVDELSVSFGTTLVIDRDSLAVRALLSTSDRHPSQRHTATSENARMRGTYLTRALDEGIVVPGTEGAELAGSTIRVRGLGRMLHLEGRA